MTPLVRLLLIFLVVSAGALVAGFLAAPDGGPVEVFDVADAAVPTAPVRLAAAVEPPALKPETGWWWNPDEPGRGFVIERSGAQIMIGALAYEADGRSSWYLSSGSMRCGVEFSSTLVSYGGGQTLSGRFRKPTAAHEAGRIGIRFLSPTQATLALPNGRAVPLERYRLDGGARPDFEPDTGWWWNPTEPGRGFVVEARNGALLLTGAMYDERGNPVWYVSHGPLAEGRTYRGRWLRLAGGMTLDGDYRVPTDAADAGSIVLEFADATAATLTLPDGRLLPINRFDLASTPGPLALTPLAAEAPATKDCAGSPVRLASVPG
ncbi:MAG: hypothetical protein EXQ95_05980 [Alphaproteobacteria bacterium]|nr:hypothetical protein [Alphaproteobacteria bacterium]